MVASPKSLKLIEPPAIRTCLDAVEFDPAVYPEAQSRGLPTAESRGLSTPLVNHCLDIKERRRL